MIFLLLVIRAFRQKDEEQELSSESESSQFSDKVPFEKALHIFICARTIFSSSTLALTNCKPFSMQFVLFAYEFELRQQVDDNEPPPLIEAELSSA